MFLIFIRISLLFNIPMNGFKHIVSKSKFVFPLKHGKIAKADDVCHICFMFFSIHRALFSILFLLNMAFFSPGCRHCRDSQVTLHRILSGNSSSIVSVMFSEDSPGGPVILRPIWGRLGKSNVGTTWKGVWLVVSNIFYFP